MKKYDITYYDINYKIDHDIKTLAETSIVFVIVIMIILF